MTNSQWMERDLRHLWHPCTQMKDHEHLPLIPIARAEGVWLYDFDGRRYLDAISSWWVNLFGHGHPQIAEAIAGQAKKLEHVLLAGFSHRPAIELAERLVALTPLGLEKVFYADNGSSAIEVALKMSYHFHRNRGEERSLFLSLSNSYHGETLGALSVGDVALYKETYQPLLIRNIQTPVPRDKSSRASEEALEALAKILAERGEEIAAMIVEPLVQGAGGMYMYGPEYLRGARELTARYGIHLIADEIMTGFGRTGTMFACEQAGIAPDFMALSKGLTGGFLPLSAVLTSDEIYGAFYCDYREYKAFLHSHSYTGNPLACAAALATLEIFETEQVLSRNRAKIRYIADKLQRFTKLDTVKSIRQTGMIAAVEMIDFPAEARKGLEVYRYGLDHEVLLRPLGNVIYFMPPYVITQEQIDRMMEVAYEGIKRLS
ncbi:adenosylmethionine--8-amino-7-oxononanoate transaminase [Nitratifractor sp.]